MEYKNEAFMPESENSMPAAPLTFKEKIANFWSRYKIHTVIAVILCVVLGIGISHCIARGRYDCRVVFYTDKVYTDEQLTFLKDYIYPNFTDTNKDGRVRIKLINCSYGDGDKKRSNSADEEIQAIAASEGDVLLYIINPTKLEQLNSIYDTLPAFFLETKPFSDEVYSVAQENGVTLPEGLVLARRIVEGTLIQGTENIHTYISAADTAMENFKG